MRHRKPELLDGRRAGLPQVIARNRDRVPARQPLAAVGEQIGGKSHGWPGRKNVGAPRCVLLQDVVLDCAVEPVPGDALLFGDELIQEEQERGGSIDRHRGADLVQRDAGEQRLHVLQRGDGHAHLAHLTASHHGVGVVTHLGRQVESNR